MDDGAIDLCGPGDDARNATVLVTRRLTLSFGTPEDAAALFPHVHGDAGRRVTDTLCWDGPTRVKDLEAFFRNHTEGTFVPHGFHWLLRDRSGALTGDPGRALGSIGITHKDTPGRGEIGYWIAPDVWGRGLMKEAVAAVVEHGFGPLRMAKIEAVPFVGNARSERVLVALGFRKEGVLRRALRKRGVWRDATVFGILPGELRAP